MVPSSNRSWLTRRTLRLVSDGIDGIGGGVLDLYHRTTPEAAAVIYSTGRWQSRENTQEVYFSTRRDGQTDGYGDGVVHVRVPVAIAELEDEFPDGEEHYRVRAVLLRPEHLVDDGAVGTPR